MAFGHLPKRTASGKICSTKQMILLKIQNMMDVKEVLLQWPYQKLFVTIY